VRSRPRREQTALVANQLPDEAARELRRVGGHPRIAAGESFASMRVSPVGSGVPSLYLEHRTLIPQEIMTHLVSMIVHGGCGCGRIRPASRTAPSSSISVAAAWRRPSRAPRRPPA
jgi:hypothetical protein